MPDPPAWVDLTPADFGLEPPPPFGLDLTPDPTGTLDLHPDLTTPDSDPGTLF